MNEQEGQLDNEKGAILQGTPPGSGPLRAAKNEHVPAPTYPAKCWGAIGNAGGRESSSVDDGLTSPQQDYEDNRTWFGVCVLRPDCSLPQSMHKKTSLVHRDTKNISPHG